MNFENSKFLTFRETEDGNKIYHIKAPCKFNITEDIIKKLQSNYKLDEEIGGCLWALPLESSGERVFLINRVSFIRNSIEDKPRVDNLTKKNAYLPDNNELTIALSEIYRNKYFPIRFHTHPIKGKNYLEEFYNFSYQSETSEQDQKVSNIPLNLEEGKLLMPKCLIVGNSIIKGELFIGLYIGFIEPYVFEQTKKEIKENNFNNVASFFSDIKLSGNDKLALRLVAILLLFLIIKYYKYSIPIILGTIAILPSLATQTGNSSKYFVQLSSGSGSIIIPEYKE